MRYRFNEHLSNARLRKLDTPLDEHTLHIHQNLSNPEINSMFRIEIIDKGKDCAEVKIKESIHCTLETWNPVSTLWKALGHWHVRLHSTQPHIQTFFSLSLLRFLPSFLPHAFPSSSLPPSSLTPPSVPPLHLSSLPLTYGYRVPFPLFVHPYIHTHIGTYAFLPPSLPLFISFPLLCICIAICPIYIATLRYEV